MRRATFSDGFLFTISLPWRPGARRSRHRQPHQREAMTQSQAMDTPLVAVGSIRAARDGHADLPAGAEWAMKQFTEWGLANVHIERFPFGQGWTIERFSVHMVAPQTAADDRPAALVLAVHQRTDHGDVVHVTGGDEADLAKYKGQLQDKIVVPQGPRRVRMLDDRVVLRMNDGRLGRGDEVPGAAGRAMPTAKPAPTPGRRRNSSRSRATLLVAEGAAAVLDRGSDSDVSAGGSDLSWQTQRVDGGTIFPGNGGSRDPKAPAQVPSATLAVEHYNRIVRLLERGQPVRMEVNIQTKFHPETDPAGNAFNIIAEIPGTDLASEVVIMGAHFDTYPVCDRRDRQHHGIRGDDRSRARHPGARLEAAPDDPRRAVGGRGARPAGIARIRARHFYDTKTKAPKPGHENVAGLFQPRQRHRPHSRHLGPGQRRRDEAIRAVGQPR